MPTGYAHEALAVVFQVRDGVLQVLLWQRARAPFDGSWALPGGSVGIDERLGSCVSRHLAAHVDVARLAHLEQLETRSDPERDPRERVLATAYLGLVRSDSEPTLPPDTAWFDPDHLPVLAFDHASIVATALDRLRAKLSYTTIAVALAPAQFTIATLRTVYAAALGHDVSPTNLQRVLLRRHALTPVGATVAASTAGGRPARLFRFTDDAVHVTDPIAVLRKPD